mgnify:CR=1 FL=1
MTLIQILFFILWAAFYGAYLLKNFLLRRQGIRADILGKGDKPKSRAVFETAIKIVTYFGAMVQVFSIAFPKAIGAFSASTAQQVSGLVFSTFGVACFIAAVVVMGHNWRAGFSAEQDTRLVTGGIYRYSRNPAFLGFDFLYIGCALAFPNPVNVVFAVAAVALFHFQILGEEKYLAGAFGQDYVEYRTKTMRYLGKRKKDNPA